MRIFKVLLMLTLVLAQPQHAQDSTLSSVKRIRLGLVGQTDEKDPFRLLLKDELEKREFVAVDDPKQADAVLTWLRVVRFGEPSNAKRTFYWAVELKTPNGQSLWGREFQDRADANASDLYKLSAQDIANELRKAVDSAAKDSKAR